MTMQKRSNSLSSIVTGTLEDGYSVSSRGTGAARGTVGSTANSIKASMVRRSSILALSSSAGRKAVEGRQKEEPLFGSAPNVGRQSNSLGFMPRASRGGNPVLDAASSGDLTALRKLLDSGGGLTLGKPDVNSRDLNGRSALMLAVTSGNKAVVDYLLTKKADVDAVDCSKKSVLHHASKRAIARRTAQSFAEAADQGDVIAILLRCRASLEVQDSNGCTALMLAVANGDESVVRSMLRAGANVAAADQEGQTSLDYAVSFEHKEMVQLLKSAGDLRAKEPLLPAEAPAPVKVTTTTSRRQTCPEVPSFQRESEGRMARTAQVEVSAKKLDAEASQIVVEEEKPEQPHAFKAERDEKAEKAERKRAKREAKEAAAAAASVAAAEAEATPAPTPVGVAAPVETPPPIPKVDERQESLSRLQALMAGSSASLGESEAEEFLKELKVAIKAAQAAGVEEQSLQEAEGFMKDLKNRSKAQDKLRQAIGERDLEKLQKALLKAEEAGVPTNYLSEAKAIIAEEEPKQRAREQLSAAQSGQDVEQLRAALAMATKVGIASSELGECESLLIQMEQRDQAASVLRTAIASRDIEALRSAIQAATQARVDSRLIAEAQQVLQEEEPKQKARQQLAEACEKCTIPELREAIAAARAAGLKEEEVTAAAEQLHREEEKLVALEAVSKAMEEVRSVDITSMDKLKEAKDKLGGAIQVATKAGVGETSLLEAEKRRKKLHNALEDLKGSIRVFCRIRPLSTKEKEQGDTDICQAVSSMSVKLEGGSTYNFDACFMPGTQEEVFEDCRDLVQSAVDGYNVTMFAYGQTGAGKTFTMYGSKENEGTAPRTIREVFRVVEEGKARFDYRVSCSMCELYCNDLVDLLNKTEDVRNAKKLVIKQDKNGTVNVENLQEEPCQSAQELLDHLARGEQQRTVACTAMNSASSRSHLVLTVKIASVNKETKEALKGKILICDLAGSERLKKSLAKEEGQKEAIEINKSLTVLGDVIEALTKSQKVIPYRNHKLTSLMQDSLGGTAKTLMFVNCSPASSNFDETQMSIKYATRAKKITNNAKKNS